MIYYNNYEIINFIISHDYLLDQLFLNFLKNIKDSISFIHEFVSIVKQFTMVIIIY